MLMRSEMEVFIGGQKWWRGPGGGSYGVLKSIVSRFALMTNMVWWSKEKMGGVSIIQKLVWELKKPLPTF